MEKPPVTCECKLFEFKKWCGHCETTWGELDYISKRFATEPYERKT